MSALTTSGLKWRLLLFMPCELGRKDMSSSPCPPPNRDLLQSGTSPSLMCCLEGFRNWRISSVSCRSQQESVHASDCCNRFGAVCISQWTGQRAPEEVTPPLQGNASEHKQYVTDIIVMQNRQWTASTALITLDRISVCMTVRCSEPLERLTLLHKHCKLTEALHRIHHHAGQTLESTKDTRWDCIIQS